MPSVLESVLKSFMADLNTENGVVAVIGIPYLIVMFMIGTIVHSSLIASESKLTARQQFIIGLMVALVFCPFIETHEMPGFNGVSAVVTIFAKTGATLVAGTASQELYTKIFNFIVSFPTNFPNLFRSSN